MKIGPNTQLTVSIVIQDLNFTTIGRIYKNFQVDEHGRVFYYSESALSYIEVSTLLLQKYHDFLAALEDLHA